MEESYEMWLKRINTDKSTVSNGLADYIAEYVKEEMYRLITPKKYLNFVDRIDRDMILSAVDAYEGGAR